MRSATCSRPPLLAHKASAEGVAAVEIMAGVREPGFDLLSIPGCIYCEPEVATVGLSEAQARERGIEVKVGKIPFRSNGKAVAINQTEGFVKIVASKEYSEVIGCQIIGHHATDLIAEVVLGRTLETTTAELGHTSIRIRRCRNRSWKRRWRPRASRLIFDRAI